MSRIPETEMTPDGPAYEGRLLDRADEPVVDQGAPFDIRTLVSRRGILGLVVLGAGTATLAACAPSASGAATATATASSTPSATPTATASASPTATASSAAAALPSGEIPDETAGPYPGDGSNGADVLEQSGIVRSDLRSSLDGGATAAGTPMTLNLTVFDTANGDVPMTGAAVYVWHCDTEGNYSMYSSGIENETYLRGVQVVGSDGVVSFTSIFPGATTAGGRTSTSRCTRAWMPSPTPPTRSPPRRSPSPRRRAASSTPTRACTRPRRRTSRASPSTATTSSATTGEPSSSPRPRRQQHDGLDRLARRPCRHHHHPDRGRRPRRALTRTERTPSHAAEPHRLARPHRARRHRPHLRRRQAAGPGPQPRAVGAHPQDRGQRFRAETAAAPIDRSDDRAPLTTAVPVASPPSTT